MPTLPPQRKIDHKIIFDLFLILLIILGVFFRFNWRNWSRGTNLHPDEYGLTNTLTQLDVPNSVSDYFNTRVSGLSPYQKYDLAGNPSAPGADNRMRWGQWPIILIRVLGELTGNTGYNEIRLLGRSLSALADSLSLLLLYAIGRRLYGHRVGILGTALSSLAVLQIQQSHFMTVDNFAVLFSTASLFLLVLISTEPCITRSMGEDGGYLIKRKGFLLFIFFGITLGMTLSSRINLLPLAGMLLIAVFLSVADLKISNRADFNIIVGLSLILIAVALFSTIATFRVTQPMSFRAADGDTSIFTVQLNPDWVESMKVARNESRGIGGGPPSEQWAKRPAIIFPFINMVLWGMGLPLGLTAWAGYFWAGWKSFGHGENWRSHLIILVWVGGYFVFMATRFVKSMRYFLPIYPFLCLLAAWILIPHKPNHQGKPSHTNAPHIQKLSVVSTAWIAAVVLGTFFWVSAFVRAVYLQDHTRIQASRWIYENIDSTPVNKPVLTNESWDEGLPLPMEGHNPFGDLYQGITMQVRWHDNEQKREMFLENLDKADYIILPSQRSIWSISRIPLTYPMTMEYYRALFDGRLGFELAEVFTSPLKLGPLWISDVGGTWAWKKVPPLPVFNYNILAAEEAFSVYDHPPVWIFEKQPDFDIQDAEELLGDVVLEDVIIQSPREAVWP